MMKKKITEQNAAATVLNSLIKEINSNWEEIWSKLHSLAGDRIPADLSSDLSKFHFIMAASSVNLRVAFDLFGRRKGERLFNFHMALMKQFWGDDERFKVVQKNTLAYMDAYNRGILQVSSPINLVAIELVLNYRISPDPGPSGENAHLLFDPATADYLSKALAIFAGKWDKMEQIFDIVQR